MSKWDSVLHTHCHSYTELLWFLAMLSLHIPLLITIYYELLISTSEMEHTMLGNHIFCKLCLLGH